MSSNGAGRCHLLLVDDEPDFREALGVLLSLEGFRVSLAPDGVTALSMLEDHLAPDVVLLDFRMPVLSGGETLCEMRARNISTPAILISAVRDLATLVERFGFDAGIRKPCSAEEVARVVSRVVPRCGEST